MVTGVELQRRWEYAEPAYRSRIRTAARKNTYVIPWYTQEDVEQELQVVLWESCSIYDPEQGSSFNTFFWMRANQHVGRMVRYASANRRSAEVITLDPEELTEALQQSLSGVSPSAEEVWFMRLDIQERGKAMCAGTASYWQSQQRKYA